MGAILSRVISFFFEPSSGSRACARPPVNGWLLGKITDKFDKSTPRLFKKFNYRIKWFDGWENHKLILENYNSGPTAPYNSWVLLRKSAAEAGDMEVD